MIYENFDKYDVEKVLKRNKKILARHYKLMREFEWTDENTQKIFALNDFIMQKECELYDNAVKIKNDLENHIKNGDTYYKTYDFEINLIYEPDDEECSPVADNKTIWDLYYSTNFDFLEHFFANEGDKTESFEKVFSRDENYNGIEHFFSCPDKSHYICRYLHCLLELDTYTFHDLLYMKLENFFTDYSVHI